MFNTKLFGNKLSILCILNKIQCFVLRRVETKLNLIYRKLHVGLLYWPLVINSMLKDDQVTT